jgi:hypothetical protein
LSPVHWGNVERNRKGKTVKNTRRQLFGPFGVVCAAIAAPRIVRAGEALGRGTTSTEQPAHFNIELTGPDDEELDAALEVLKKRGARFYEDRFGKKAFELIDTGTGLPLRSVVVAFKVPSS